MKKHTRLIASVLTVGVLIPAVVSPSFVSAAAPDSLVYSLNGKQVKVDYSDYEDVLFGENPDLTRLLTGQSPIALGVGNSFIHYSDYEDLLFTEMDKDAYEIIDVALQANDKLVDEETKSKYQTIIGFENGQPIYSDGTTVDGEFKVIGID
ncbi:hypothetical protein ORD22_08195 [Sporosarcina sp. GW1-11]|uniref:hypothetical protein n=1 Tax=Sporosarcina sp. GW1-11 TaxID=2899126 RepID=UPI00294E7F8B|nr:hypothetical protein [Sporosarcina sp. GW1-11]MDV6378227.1 hypothetical protein [Sporosarcina sp. GW1-11]